MRIALKKLLLLPMTLLLLVISPHFLTCDVDHGLGVSQSRIQGRLILPDMSQRPDYFQAVRIVALTKTLDADDVSLNDAVFSNKSIDLGVPNPTFDLPAPISKYEFVGAVWKHRDKGWDYTKIFGFYGFDPDSFKYDVKPIYLTKAQPIVDNIEIVCDWIFVSE
jgi:hypothetical protein